MIIKLSPDVIVLTEIKADAGTTVSKNLRGSQCFQILSQRGTTAPSRTGVAILLRTGLNGSMICRNERTTENKNDPIQTVKVRLARNVVLIGIYASPQISGKALTEALESAHIQSGEDVMIIGDLKAKNVIWKRLSNGQGVSKLCEEVENPSFFAKGKQGWSKPDLLSHRNEAQVEKEREVSWNDISEHAPLLYVLRDIKPEYKKHRRVAKIILTNERNREKVSCNNRDSLTTLIDKLKSGDRKKHKAHSKK